MKRNRKKHFIFCLIESLSLIAIFCVSSVAFADSTIRVTWLANSEPDLGGYYLYFGTSSGNYGPPVHIQPNITTYTLEDLTEGTMYYIALSAHDLSDNESAKCPEINGVAPTTTTIPSSTTTTTSNASSSQPTSSTTTIPPPTTTTTVVTTTISVPPNNPLTPSGTISINEGQEETGSPSVILHLSANDYNGEPLSENGMMSFSNDGLQWYDPEPFATEKLWVLTPGEEIKTVYVLFGDSEGNWMVEPSQDKILYKNSQITCEDLTKLGASSISVSSELLPFFSKENALDGDPSTLWSTPYRLFQREEFYTIDLGDIKNIGLLSMYASRIFGTDFFPSNFKIQASNDKISWVDMNTVQGYSTPLDQTSAGNWEYNNLSCRYIKVFISKCRSFLFFFRVAQISEIEIFGCDTTKQQPHRLFNEEGIVVNSQLRQANITKKRAEHKTIDQYNETPTIPGKPIIKFHK
jgi:hypothetical protein